MIKVLVSFAKYNGFGSYAVGEEVEFTAPTEKYLTETGFAKYVKDEDKEDKTEKTTKEDKTVLEHKTVKLEDAKQTAEKTQVK